MFRTHAIVFKGKFFSEEEITVETVIIGCDKVMI